MKAVTIASGSKGNCTYIATEEVKILVDIGLSCTCLEERLNILNIEPKSIDAILITHEHTDHCCGIGAFARKYKTKIYMHTQGYPYIIKKLGKVDPAQIICYASNEFFLNDVSVSVIEVPHDSKFCVGYSFLKANKKVSIITDVGKINQGITDKLAGSDILFIEANHDEQMLLNNPKYSMSLKNRILSPKGHLSNKACGELVSKLVYTGVKQVVLSHLSEENNTPDLAYNTVKKVLEQNGITEGEHVFVDVSLQHSIGTVFEIKD